MLVVVVMPVAWSRSMRLTALASFVLLVVAGIGRETLAWQTPPQGRANGTSRALVIVGLPGDSDHETSFAAVATAWRDWLVGPLGFPANEVRILSGTPGIPGRNDEMATGESIAREAQSIREKSRPSDRLWVFVLGHANLDEGRAFIHLAGPDLDSKQFASFFRDIASREQVFWITTPASGAFIKPLATAGRVVVAATEPDGEVNETEFPTALAEVGRLAPARLDLNRDGQVSLSEVVDTTAEVVEARFLATKRVPTEHSRIDDNGDGIATELRSIDKPANPDGAIAAKMILMKVAPQPPANPPARSENGTKPVVPPRH